MAEALILEFEGFGKEIGPPARAEWLDLAAHNSFPS